MKLSYDEFERTGDVDPLVLYTQAIKSAETRTKYDRTLRNMLCVMLEDILHGTFEERARELICRGREDPDWVRDLLLSVSRKLRERTEHAPDHPQYLNPSSFSNYFKPVKKLLDMNDVTIPWKRVYSTFPEQNNISNSTRGWTRAEIQKMLMHSHGPIDHAVILVCASSGIRVGGFEGLEWRDLTPIYYCEGDEKEARYNDHNGNHSNSKTTTKKRRLCVEDDNNEKNLTIACARLQIYRGSSEEYPAFITPEAYEALLEYKADWAHRVGHAPEPHEPMFIRMGDLPRKASKTLIKKRVQQVVSSAALRDEASIRNKPRRHTVPIMNGFRRFWNKSCKESLSGDSALSSLIKKEYMMGHAGLVSLDRNYFKTHMLELAEEYLHSVPALTINDTVRLRTENTKQANTINKITDERDAEIEGLRKMIVELTARFEESQK